MKKNKSGQVWIETVVYTLIAFALIGAALTFIKPKIEEIQDKSLLDQSVEMLQDINSIISSIGTSGNVRVIDLNIKKGVLKIDPKGDLIIFEMESSSVYSEPGQKRERDNVIILTEQYSGINKVTITTNYSAGYNLTFNGQDDTEKLLNKAPNPYKFSIENKGVDGDKILINLNIA